MFTDRAALARSFPRHQGGTPMSRRLLSNIDLIVAAAALLVVVGSVSWGVLTRYILPQPATWTTELSGIAFAWVVFFGAAAAMREGAHIGIPLLVDLLPPAVRKGIMLFSGTLIVAFLAYSTFLASDLAVDAMNRPSPVLRIPFGYVYAGVAVALALLAVRALVLLWKIARSADGEPFPHGGEVHQP